MNKVNILNIVNSVNIIHKANIVNKVNIINKVNKVNIVNTVNIINTVNKVKFYPTNLYFPRLSMPFGNTAIVLLNSCLCRRFDGKSKNSNRREYIPP